MKPVTSVQEKQQQFLLRWFSLDVNGWEMDKMFTFHNYLGGWYLELNRDWASRISVEQEQDMYTFYVWDDSYQQATMLFKLFHNYLGGWYLELNRDWASRISVEQEQDMYTFYVWDDSYQQATMLFKLYHNYLGGWYLELNRDWASRISVEQEQDMYTFYVWDDSYQQATMLFKLYVFTGTDRDKLASGAGRFPLYRAEGVAYAASLEYGAADYGITQDQLIEAFHLLRQDRQYSGL